MHNLRGGHQQTTQHGTQAKVTRLIKAYTKFMTAMDSIDARLRKIVLDEIKRIDNEKIKNIRKRIANL